MRIQGVLLTFVAALLVTGCGGVAAPPTSPTLATSVQSTQRPAATGTIQQSLVGAWRGAVSSKAVRAGSTTTVGFSLNCSQRWEISSQSGDRFEGQMSSQGSSPESDWRCIQVRAFAGEIAPDGRVTISFSPGFAPGGCRNVAGGERATGSVSGDAIKVDLPYRATCEMALGGGASWWDLEIAATITLTRW